MSSNSNEGSYSEKEHVDIEKQKESIQAALSLLRKGDLNEYAQIQYHLKFAGVCDLTIKEDVSKLYLIGLLEKYDLLIADNADVNQLTAFLGHSAVKISAYFTNAVSLPPESKLFDEAKHLSIEMNDIRNLYDEVTGREEVIWEYEDRREYKKIQEIKHYIANLAKLNTEEHIKVVSERKQSELFPKLHKFFDQVREDVLKWGESKEEILARAESRIHAAIMK